MSDYSSTYPTQSPTFAFDAKAGKLDSRISYSRSSTGTYLSNESHLSSENLVPYSNLSSGFLFGRTTLASTNNSAPDGGNDAASILETADPTSSHEVYQSFSCVSGQQYSFVFYLKANGRTKVMLRPQMTSVIADVEYDLTAVTSTVVSGSADHSITAIGSTGWYKCAVTVTATATGTGYTQFNLLDAGGNIAYTGDVTKGVFAWGASVASTGQTVVNQTIGQIHREYAPLLKTASANEPRLEYDASGNSKGLLIESQATNLVTHSADFDDSSWAKVRSEIDSNAAIAPDGTLTADYLRAASDSANGAYVTKLISVSSNATVNVSFFHKKTGGDNYALITTYNGVNGTRQWFNLSTGGLGNSTDFGSGFSVLNAGVEEVGNGWVRLNVTVSCTGSSVGVSIYPSVATDGGYASSVATTNALIWGAMLTESSSPSSYIATTSSQFSRASDSCSVATADFGYTGGDVSIFAEITDAKGDYPTVARLRNTTTGDGLFLYKSNANSASSANLDYRSYDGGLKTNFAISGSGGATKVAIVAETNRFAGVADGGTVAENLSSSVPAGLDTLNIGGQDTQYVLNGNIKRLSLFNVALSDVELQSLTSS